MQKRETKKTQWTIRVEPHLMDSIKVEAEKQNRSINNYIETILSKNNKNLQQTSQAR